MSASLERPESVKEVASSPEASQAKENLSAEYRNFLASSRGSVPLSDINSLEAATKADAVSNSSSSSDSVTGKVLDFKPARPVRESEQPSGQLEIPDGIYKRPAEAEAPFRFNPGDSRTERPASQSDRSEDNPLVFSGNDAISLIARKADGHPIWKQSRYSEYLDNGRQADAASVSLVLQSVGYDYADSANNNNLVKKLVANGWQLVGVSQAKEGDVIVGGKLGTRWNQDSRNAHIGIVGPGGSVYHSDANTGNWTNVSRQDAFDPAVYGDQVFILRPPLDPPGQNRDIRDNFRRDINPGYSDGPSYSDNRPGYSDYRPGSSDYRPREQETWQRYDDQRRSQNGESDYWRDYWKQYWSDYWRDYWSQYYRSGDRSGNRPGDGPYDRRYEGPPGNSEDKSRRIYDAARSSVGRRMWQQSDFAPDTSDGRLGATSSVSEVLQAAGFQYANGGRVSTLARQLLARGWQPVSLDQLRPGDVLYGGKNERWEEGGGNAHIAIVGTNGRVFHNDSRSGVWSEADVRDAFSSQEFGRRVWALRPPDQEVYIAPQRDEYAYRDYPGQDPNGYERRRRGDYSPGGNASLAEIASNSVGRQLWRFIRGTPARLGCAASVSAVLSAGGYDYARNAGVGGLEGQLLNNGWRKMHVSEAQPGDVVIGARTANYRAGGGGSHIGIVGYNGKVYHNSSGQAQWIETGLNSYYNTSRFRAGVWILRPPGSYA